MTYPNRYQFYDEVVSHLPKELDSSREWSASNEDKAIALQDRQKECEELRKMKNNAEVQAAATIWWLLLRRLIQCWLPLLIVWHAPNTKLQANIRVGILFAIKSCPSLISNMADIPL